MTTALVTDRRTRFREYMRRLDPTGDPAQAVTSGYYVPPPNAVSQRIATRIELESTSSHLMMGGIGSGKTTELIAIERRLVEVEDLFPIRIDVPSRHRLDRLKPGVLVALAATEACEQLGREQKAGVRVDTDLEEQARRVSAIARGHSWDPSDQEAFVDDDRHWAPGILERPEPSEDVSALSDALSHIHGALRRKLVLLFDGLDRVTDLAVLASVLAEDIPALGRAGVGVVVVGPQQLHFSPQRSVESAFSSVHVHGPTSAETPEGHEFLTAVLRARANEDLLPPDSASAVIAWSGGLLRDLVAMGRAAAAEAYAGGADAIGAAHVASAADRFSRT